MSTDIAENLERPSTRGLLRDHTLPHRPYDALWDSIIVEPDLKARLLAQAVLTLSHGESLKEVSLPLHGVILMVGPPGTGKTTLARGLASRTAASFSGAPFQYLEVEPHALANASLGRSQQAVSQLLGGVIVERAMASHCIVVLDEVETLVSDRSKMSLEANPIDVHRATDAVLAQLDALAESHSNILFIATSNYVGAIDEAFLSRADLVVTVDVPNEQAAEEILRDSVARLGQAFPALKGLSQDPALAEAAAACVGLDGRRIRKAVLGALAQSKEIAANPSKLTPDAIVAAARRAQAEVAQLRSAQ